MNIPRAEYPRPQMKRDSWLNLNGEWDFKYDDGDLGIKNQWFKGISYDKKIIVPYTYHSELSLIDDHGFHDIVWYERNFNLPEDMLGKRIILNFGAVDYKADVWINGIYVTSHEGGHVPFSIEITGQLLEETNRITLRAEDYSFDLELPRGKQYWLRESGGIFYTRTTGIWQTVWIEAVGVSYIKKIWLTPDVDKKMIKLEYEIEGSAGLEMNVNISLKGHTIVSDSISIINGRGKREFFLDQGIMEIGGAFFEDWTWSPERPTLFDVKLTLKDKDGFIDEIGSYFGMRKISVVNGEILLNNHPYYQKLLLDQGYWEESLLTAPTDNHFIRDIKLAKEMGFNGVRKHEKIEDPRFLYHADKLGFLVWGEMPSAYVYSREYTKRMTREWTAVLERDYNHPCIIVWVPHNESWGIDNVMQNKDEQAFATAMYYLTKSIDQTRLVISNDGWEHTKSDLLTIHDYQADKKILLDRYKSLDNILAFRHNERRKFAHGWSYDGQPIMITECGGVSYQKSEWSGWGYTTANSDEDFSERYYNIISPLLESPLIQGFVYTQITDVEQEINGLLTYAREGKVDPSIIRAINESKGK